MGRTLIATLALIMCAAVPASAAQCVKRDKALRILGTQYKEQRKAVGMVPRRGIMEIYVSESTGTWTVLVTTPRGVSCVIAAGEHYENAKPVPVADPDA